MAYALKRYIALFFISLFTLFIGESSLHSFVHSSDNGHTHLSIAALEAPFCHQATTTDAGFSQIGLESDVCKICASFIVHAAVELASVASPNLFKISGADSVVAIHSATLPEIDNLLLRGPPAAFA